VGWVRYSIWLKIETIKLPPIQHETLFAVFRKTYLKNYPLAQVRNGVEKLNDGMH